MLRFAHYLNQFFAGMGGEESANLAPLEREGALGPGRMVDQLLDGEGAIVSTFVCGDTFFNEHPEAARSAVRRWLEAVEPDAVLAGPAFAAGRYGSACAQVSLVADELGLVCVSGMHPENAGRIVDPKGYVVPAQRTPAGMADVLRAMVALARSLADGAALGPAESEGYLPRGVRRPGLRERPGAERAVEMLVARLRGEAFRTEIPVDRYELVPPAPPLRDLATATVAVVTTGAIVPKGNPDRLKRCSETRWRAYPLDGGDRLSPDDYECVHGGFYNLPASENPNLVLPLDALRALERAGTFDRLHEVYYTTTGNDQRLLDCKRNGAEIASALEAAHVDGVLLVAT